METETAYAKLNLALHVRRRRDDGYHELETIFAFCEDGDTLTGIAADAFSLRISGPFAKGLSDEADNLVLRAAQAVQAEFDVQQGAALHLTKVLPIASGIGGGSADAAAALRLLARLWRLDAHDSRFMAIAAKLGADVPACVASVAAVGLGTGTALTPFRAIDAMPVLLVNPLVQLSTADVFAHWDGVDRGALDADDPLGWRNDLTAPALKRAPAVGRILAQLQKCAGLRAARMSGSGATCFAVFESDAARDAAAMQFGREWVFSTRLRRASVSPI